MANPPHNERLLILTKTYPAPSTKHQEISCVAAINSDGAFRRLYPVPFRLLDGSQQFKKWEWIDAKIQKATDDRRPESHRIFIDTILRTEEVVGTKNNWHERRRWIEQDVVTDFEVVEERRQKSGRTLAYLRPKRIVGLEISEAREPEWSPEEKAKLVHKQDGLFDTEEMRAKSQLRKLPFDFYYRYECDGLAGAKQYKHKITDWEVGALFWNVQRAYGKKWEQPFREKLEIEFGNKDVLFLMGTIHRFPDHWLIVGLAYPPRQRPVEDSQLGLTF